MKKTLVTLLALVFVLSIAATAFAAPANPFVDVPAKHWAYGAVSKLVKAGVVDGYGDGTFRGDKTMTRYEMAQIVAKAMARSEKADAQTKALIDKLAVEFAAELNNLGVRVAKLEANQSNIKLTGNAAFRYTTTKYHDVTPMVPTSNSAQYRLRLDGVAKVDDKTTAGFRFVTREPDRAAFGNDTWQTFGENGQSQGNGNATATIDRLFFTTKIGDVKTTLGRQMLDVDTMGAIMDKGAFSYDGLKFAVKSGDFTIDAKWGRFLKGAKLKDMGTTAMTYAGNATTRETLYGDLDVASLGVSSKAGKLAYGVSYTSMKNPVGNFTPIKWLLLDTTYTFDKKWTLQTEYLKNSAEKVIATKGDTALLVQLTFGDFVINKKGANNLFFRYADRKANSYPHHFASFENTTGTSYAGNFMNEKNYTVGYNYGFSKTWSGAILYAWTTPDDDTVAKAKLKQLRVLTTVVF